ncbi:MAG: GNAT family protein [Burkholderiaceae bacterium]|nr:GNAT family protein [Burkholderiaceae bacterium]
MKRVLHTERLRLRAPQPGDEHAAFDGWAQDPDVLRYLGWRPHGAIADTRTQLDWDQARWLKRSAWTWLLVEPRGAAIGLVQLIPQRFDGPAHHLRLGYLLARGQWGRGLMREAVAAVLSEAFAQTPVWRIDALCDVDNHASARLLHALGFAHEGVLRRHSLHPNVSAEPRDVTVHARLRPDGA